MSIKNFLFQNNSHTQTVAKNTFWLSLGQGLGRLIRVIIIIYAARVLGADSWGAFSYALSLAAFFSIFSDLGVNSFITRELVKNETNQNLIGPGLTLKALVVIIILVLTPFLAPFLTNINEAIGLIPLAILVFAFDSIRDTASAVSRAKQKMEWEALSIIITNVSIVLFGFLALYYFHSATALLWSYVLGSALGALILMFLTLPTFLKQNYYPTFSKIKSLLKITLPFAIVAIMGAVMINTDTIIIGWLLGATATGLYAAAQKPVQLLYLIPALLTTSLFPLIASLSKYNSPHLKETLEQSLSALNLIALPLAFGGFLIGPDLIILMFGPAYASAGLSLSLLSLSLIFIFPSILIGNIIFALGQEKKLIAYSLIGIFGNFLLDMLLIPKFGINGAALATILIQAIINSYLLFQLKNIIRLKLFSRLKKISLATFLMVLMVIFLSALNTPILLLIPLSALLYFLILFILKEPTLNFILSRLKKPRTY